MLLLVFVLEIQILAELSFSLSVLCLAVLFFLARPGFQVSGVDFTLMSF